MATCVNFYYLVIIIIMSLTFSENLVLASTISKRELKHKEIN